MTQSMVTCAMAFDRRMADAVDDLLGSFRPELFHRSGKIRDALRGKGVHFLSITVVRGDGDEPTHLVVEVSGDGSPDTCLASVAAGLEPWLKQIAATAEIPVPGSLSDWLAENRIRTGHGLFSRAGLDFCGTPGMTIERIEREYALSTALRKDLDDHPPTGTAFEAFRRMRERIAADPQLSPLLQAEPVARIAARDAAGVDLGFVLGLVAKAVTTFLWPVLLLLGLLVVAATIMAACAQGTTVAILTFVLSLLIAGIAFLGVVAALYLALRRAEAANTPIDTPPDPAVLTAISDLENLKDTQQNHLAGISVMQAGWLRELTLRLAFFVIGEMAAKRFRPGFLGDIGTIHFARWVRLPKTDKLLFFSNFGGSWESYLEDFITKASNGLTGAWSNTLGFPRTENLFFKGSTDGDRFKRWARRQQQPSRFWYSAYPHLTTARIRTNAAIRRGLATIESEDEAAAWLGLFGSTVRPSDLIESAEVQTLFYGGLSRHRFAAYLVVVLPDAPAAAKSWLAGILPRVTFGDEPPSEEVLVLGLSASGLRRLGLPDDVALDFPAAFRAGMSSAGRANLIGDTGDDDARHWLLGGPDKPVDAVLLVYADSQELLARNAAALEASIVAAGGRQLHTVTAQPLKERKESQIGAGVAFEPFGFADGVSQPIVRGTRRWLRQSDAIHTVEPGEFLLGYPDGRGHLPPSPTVPSALDPGRVLPHADLRSMRDLLIPDFGATDRAARRDLGRNGTFMVVRQLAQDVGLFERFVGDAAETCAGHPAVPRQLPREWLKEWIGAKMIGRWKDGSSLVRFPHGPATKRGHDPGRFRPDNEFLPGVEDPLGERCPLGSHIRRSNPRDSQRPGSPDEIAIVNRHRILRVGRGFEASGANDPEVNQPGLLFVCLNADIERQFEFIQQTWAMAWQFHGLANEVDPIIGRGQKLGRLTIPSPNGPLHLSGIKDFVRTRGGAYLFMPSRSALRFLAGNAAAALPPAPN